MDVSAVCQYQIADVKMVFKGYYKEYREASQRWGRYTGAVPVPRPGSVRFRNTKFFKLRHFQAVDMVITQKYLCQP